MAETSLRGVSYLRVAVGFCCFTAAHDSSKENNDRGSAWSTPSVDFFFVPMTGQLLSAVSFFAVQKSSAIMPFQIRAHHWMASTAQTTMHELPLRSMHDHPVGKSTGPCIPGKQMRAVKSVRQCLPPHGSLCRACPLPSKTDVPACG